MVCYHHRAPIDTNTLTIRLDIYRCKKLSNVLLWVSNSKLENTCRTEHIQTHRRYICSLHEKKNNNNTNNNNNIKKENKVVWWTNIWEWQKKKKNLKSKYVISKLMYIHFICSSSAYRSVRFNIIRPGKFIRD